VVQEKFREMLSHQVRPFLKEKAYRRKGNNFYKPEDGLIYLINFQKSAFNRGEFLCFYINCGIYSPEYADRMGNEPLDFPKETDCHWRSRIEEIAAINIPGFQWFQMKEYNADTLWSTIMDALQEVDQFFSTINRVEFLTKLTSEKIGDSHFRPGAYLLSARRRPPADYKEHLINLLSPK
jgi:hypothetical protein